MRNTEHQIKAAPSSRRHREATAGAWCFLRSRRALKFCRLASLVFVGVATLMSAPGALAQKTNEPLIWSTLTNEVTAQPGAVSAHLYFSATNVSARAVVIDSVKTSCGCTSAKLPSQPWRLAPGDGGRMEITVDLRNKTGTLLKAVSIRSADAPKELLIKVNIPPPGTNALSPAMADRMWNLEVATADRQAVFRSECAKCHLEPVFGKNGVALYQTACGICHDSPHRATMVPDLTQLKVQSGEDYWRNIIAHGKPGTLMPGSAATDGGPLDNSQIDWLVAYFLQKYPPPREDDDE